MLSSQAIFDLINGIEKKEMAFWVDGNTGPFAIDMINGSCTGNLTKIGKEIEESGVNVLISPVEITREGESIWLVPELNQTDIQMNSFPERRLLLYIYPYFSICSGTLFAAFLPEHIWKASRGYAKSSKDSSSASRYNGFPERNFHIH